MEWYHVWWPWMTCKRVAWFVSDCRVSIVTYVFLSRWFRRCEWRVNDGLELYCRLLFKTIALITVAYASVDQQDLLRLLSSRLSPFACASVSFALTSPLRLFQLHRLSAADKVGWKEHMCVVTDYCLHEFCVHICPCSYSVKVLTNVTLSSNMIVVFTSRWGSWKRLTLYAQ